MIEPPEFLPIGSVVNVANAGHPLMIVSRAIVHQREDGCEEYFDYSLVLYPEGLIDDEIVFTNHDCIEEVLFEGLRDQREQEQTKVIQQVVKTLAVPKGDPMDRDMW